MHVVSVYCVFKKIIKKSILKKGVESAHFKKVAIVNYS